jgi:hypothetical protein
MSEQQAEYRIEGRPATIFRTVHDKDNPYAIVNLQPILNCNLSWKAKGILVYLLSRPDGWEVNLVDLTNRSIDGLASVKSGCKELKKAGHLKHAGTRKASGQFETVIWEVYEVPQVDNQLTDIPQVGVPEVGNQPTVSPQVDFPQVENPQVDNRTQVLKNLSNKESNSIKERAPKIQGIEASILQSRPTEEADIKASQNDFPFFPPAERELLLVYSEVTGQKPTKAKITDWLCTAQEWLELHATQSDVRTAYRKAHPESGNGFNVMRPGSLTNAISMVVGERHTSGPGKASVQDQISKMLNGR